MSKIKMADIWGWDAIPQDYGHYESFTLNGVEHKGDFYGLLFCTKEAANAVSHAVKNHDQLEQESTELREALRKIEKACSDNCEQSYFSIQVECIAHEALNK